MLKLRIIKTKYNYSFEYMLWSDIKNYRYRYTSPKILYDEFNKLNLNDIIFIGFIGFNIQNEEQYVGKKTKILISYKIDSYTI